MQRIIAVANQKGGVAKTTTVASLGVAWAELGKRVLLVDLDPQACLTFSLGLDPETLTTSMHDVLVGRVGLVPVIATTAEGVSLAPATIDLAGTEAQLLTRTGREFVLRGALREVSERYDIILIDCSPSLGVLTINALTAAHEVLIPLQCETLSHRGVGQLLDTIAEVRRFTNPDLAVLGVLPTLFDARTNHSRAVVDDIATRYGLAVLGPQIPRSIRFAEAPAAGRSVLSGASFRGASAYRELAARLLAGTAATPATPAAVAADCRELVVSVADEPAAVGARR